MKIIPKRFYLLAYFSLTILFFALLVRLVLYVLAFNYIDFSILNLLKIFCIGFFFDMGSLLYLLAIYAIYLLIIPTKFHGKKLDRILQKFFFGLFMFVYIFSFLAEVPFWQEYQRRYNFIAVDYLLYTYEVIENIHQTFPLPFLIGVIVLILISSIWFASKKGAYKATFNNSDSFFKKLVPTFFIITPLVLFHFFINNKDAEFSENNNESELSKSGMYSFFSAYKSNELDYNEFYNTLPKDVVYNTLYNNLLQEGDSLITSNNSILRSVKNNGEEQKPNIIFIGLESMSASFLERYGNTSNLTPAIDSLQKKSIAFTNMFATGTRTIRGLESITLSIPPTPGRSIIKRANNENLFTIGEVFKQKGYSRTFIYGGDSHFDNMLSYFSNNGFDIVDRKKNFRIQKVLATKRTQIQDNEVTFENAWGACDGDLYKKLLKHADLKSKQEKPFFFLLMNSSNHHPYSFPKNVINSEEQTRDNAVKYADKTFNNFFKEAKTKPWFKNTVFVVVADHCAYSAGRTELNIKNHHIPAFIYNLKDTPNSEVDKLSSQIDIFPTLFGYLNWSYNSNFFGRDITKVKPDQERAYIGNHRKVALLKKDILSVLETNKQHRFYLWNKTQNSLEKTPENKEIIEETISYYQSAFDLLKSNKLKVDKISKK